MNKHPTLHQDKHNRSCRLAFSCIIMLLMASTVLKAQEYPNTALVSTDTGLLANLAKQQEISLLQDSLKRHLFELKNAYYTNYYQLLISNADIEMDTTFQSKDSMVVDYINRLGKVIRRDINKFTSIHYNGKDTLVQEYLQVKYFNEQCLVESYSFYALIASAYDCPEDGMTCNIPLSKKLLDPYLPQMRFKYDHKNRLILAAFNYYVSFRMRYFYQSEKDVVGRPTADSYTGLEVSTIGPFDFWDD